MSNPTVKTIVAEYLRAHGYDGLWHCDAPCGCEIDDLEPCEQMSSECKAGYKTAGCNPVCGNCCDWHIGPAKEGDA